MHGNAEVCERPFIEVALGHRVEFDDKPLLDDREIQFVRKLFADYRVKPFRSFQKSTVSPEFANPFYYIREYPEATILLDPTNTEQSTVILSQGVAPTDELNPLFKKTFEKLVQRAVQLMFSAGLNSKSLNGKSAKVSFYSISTPVAPNKRIHALSPHFDLSHIQLILPISRPDGLRGAKTTFSESKKQLPQIRAQIDSRLEVGTYFDAKDVAETYNPDLEINHAMIFWGQSLLHGASASEVYKPKSDQPKGSYRETIGISIVFY